MCHGRRQKFFQGGGQQGRRNIGRSGGASKKLRAMETFEKPKKNRHQLCFLLFNNVSKIIKETVENVFHFDLDKP